MSKTMHGGEVDQSAREIRAGGAGATILRCSWCGEWMGLRDGRVPVPLASGRSVAVSHGLCLGCRTRLRVH